MKGKILMSFKGSLKGTLAVGVLFATVLMSARFVLDTHERAGIDTGVSPSTLSMAPISLGNRAMAATLKVRLPDLPGGDGTPPSPIRMTLRAEKGTTLSGLLRSAGVSRTEAETAIAAVRKIFDPRRIKPGQIVTLTFDVTGGTRNDTLAPGKFKGLTLPTNYAKQVTVARKGDGTFEAEMIDRPYTRSLVRSEGEIRQSLYLAGTQAGVPLPVLAELIRAYSWDLDFQRDIRPGDGFEVLFEQIRDDTGKTVNTGKIVYAALRLSGEKRAIYFHKTRDGEVGYFNEKGASARKALLRTPINGARLSSRFGKRRHPVLGYTKMHRGVDFAAPRGTPIYAAGNGAIDYAGRKGGYGVYIRIRHNGRYDTAYAHMKGLARGIRKGKRVRQGQTIGYVGSTGRSTGPHLHYEILRAGRQVNPLRVKMPSGRKLKGAELAHFQALRGDIDRTFAALAPETTVASAL